MMATPELGPAELIDYWPFVTRIGWFVVGFLAVVMCSQLLVRPALERVLRQRNHNNPTLQNAVLLYFQVFVVVIALLVGAGVAGYGPFLGDSALLISAIALAIGVAAQEVIGSIVSGIALVLDPEFNVGDYIEWSTGEGVVQSISIRVTRVETPNGKLVTIPNTILTNNEITRPYGRGNYRIVQELTLAYDADVAEATALLETVATSVDGILSHPSPAAYVDALGDNGVTITVHYWVPDPSPQEVSAVRSDFAGAVKRRFEDTDLTLGPPSQHDLQGSLDISDFP